MPFLEYIDRNDPYFRRTPLQRPARPNQISAELINRFIHSDYARQTTLADFVQAHRAFATQGTLMVLHRRHIVSWFFIQKFFAFCATLALEHYTELKRNVGFNCDVMAEHLGVEVDLRRICGDINRQSKSAALSVAPVAQLQNANRGNAARAHPIGVNIGGHSLWNMYDSYSAELERLAYSTCWEGKNVWIGPSQGNVGTDVDTGDDGTMDLPRGTPFRSLAVTDSYDALCASMAALNFS